jgi:ArsR family transcriptional regulator
MREGRLDSGLDNIKQRILKRQADFCKALGDPKRLNILQELRGGEMTVNKLAGKLGLKQSNASQHLAVLRRIGLITPRKVGNVVYYSLVNPKIMEACDVVHEVIADQLQNEQQLASHMENSR